jgi:hypothetical protein
MYCASCEVRTRGLRPRKFSFLMRYRTQTPLLNPPPRPAPPTCVMDTHKGRCACNEYCAFPCTVAHVTGEQDTSRERETRRVSVAMETPVRCMASREEPGPKSFISAPCPPTSPLPPPAPIRSFLSLRLELSHRISNIQRSLYEYPGKRKIQETELRKCSSAESSNGCAPATIKQHKGSQTVGRDPHAEGLILDATFWADALIGSRPEHWIFIFPETSPSLFQANVSTATSCNERVRFLAVSQIYLLLIFQTDYETHQPPTRRVPWAPSPGIKR